VGTQLVPLAFVEGAFQQGAEDCGFNLFPVGLGCLYQQRELDVVEGYPVRQNHDSG